jgi:hypothetical protein
MDIENLREFNREIDDFAKKEVPEATVAFHKKIALTALDRVIKKSPVGNPDLWKRPRKGYVGGRFRGNWQVEVNSYPEEPIDRIDPGGGATMAAGSIAIAGVKFGDIVWLVNNVLYGERIEKGHSTQAPAGVVAVTLQELMTLYD